MHHKSSLTASCNLLGPSDPYPHAEVLVYFLLNHPVKCQDHHPTPRSSRRKTTRAPPTGRIHSITAVKKVQILGFSVRAVSGINGE